jgi:hypothetical protein
MLFFSPTHESVNVEVVVGVDETNLPILKIGDRVFEIPERILKSLSEISGFGAASQQERVKTYLFEMLGSAS